MLWFALGLLGMSGVSIVAHLTPISDLTQGLLYGVCIGMEMVGLILSSTTRRVAAPTRSRIR